jgi:hypothetical protein
MVVRQVNRRQDYILMVSLLMIMETLDSLFELNVIGYTLEEVRIKIEKQLLEDYFKKGQIFCDCKLAGYTINGDRRDRYQSALFRACYNPRGYC